MADQESPSAGAVGALMSRRAAELAGFATLNVVSLDQEDEVIELVPVNPRAARVTVTHSPGVADGEVFVGVGDETTDMPGLIEVFSGSTTSSTRRCTGGSCSTRVRAADGPRSPTGTVASRRRPITSCCAVACRLPAGGAEPR